MIRLFRKPKLIETAVDLYLIRKFKKTFRSFARVGHIPLLERDTPLIIIFEGSSGLEAPFLFWLNRHWLGRDLLMLITSTETHSKSILDKVGMLVPADSQAIPSISSFPGRSLVCADRESIDQYFSEGIEAGWQALPFHICIRDGKVYFGFGELLAPEEKRGMKNLHAAFQKNTDEALQKIDAGMQFERMLKGKK